MPSLRDFDIVILQAQDLFSGTRMTQMRWMLTISVYIRSIPVIRVFCLDPKVYD
jgi:hypothetical protein